MGEAPFEKAAFCVAFFRLSVGVSDETVALMDE
jgi:hypothetical protein